MSWHGRECLRDENTAFDVVGERLQSATVQHERKRGRERGIKEEMEGDVYKR